MIEGLRGTHSGPLGRAAKLVLMLCASLTILACYLFSILSVVGLLLFIAVEFVLILALARFGLSGWFIQFLQRHLMIVGIFVKNLWLPRGTEYQIPLAREDAPKLFAMLDSMAVHMKISPPQQVVIEMNCGAWVRLRGIRKGAGKTSLGIGYDLLAVLDVSEFEAVMAHEMTHAKLVERGLKSWLNGGLARIARVSNALGECLAAYRAQNASFASAGFFRNGADTMTRLAAHLVASYSRQDEFEADRGAAELCGAEPLRTSLLRLNVAIARLGRLPWAERVSRIETESSFSGWLTKELSVTEAEALGAAGVEARDPYSTHPALHDRLAALPAIEKTSTNTEPAMGLLRDPDHIAADLSEEIHRVLAEQEQKDSLLLAKSARKLRGAQVLGRSWVPALFLFGMALVFGVGMFSENFSGPLMPVGFVLFTAAGIWALRLSKYRGVHTLPVPRYAELKKAWREPLPPDLGEREKEIESEFKAAVTGKKSERLKFLINEAFAALGRCEYLRAHVATRLAMDIHNKNVEVALGHAIASAGLRTSIGNNLMFVRANAGISAPQIVWGTAWALTLTGEWNNAEALLWKAHQETPDEPTFLLLLAFVQQQRGKLQSAILNAEKAVDLTPGDLEAIKLLGQCLLDAGRLHAAAERLAALEPVAQSDAELVMLMVRVRLLQQNLESAQEWSGHMRKGSHATPWMIRMGEAFETARHDQIAADYFGEVLDAGYYPEAYLGLARIAARRKENAIARRHLLSALDMEKTLPDDAVGPIPLFKATVNHLMQLLEPREGCKAWIVTFSHLQNPHNPVVLRGCRLLIYARTQEEAEGFVDEMLGAMQQKVAPLQAKKLHWAPAPRDQQPIRPVLPGIQSVLAGS